MIDGHAAPLVIDVRQPGEFDAGHVPGAVNWPASSLATRASIAQYRDEPVVLYCGAGPRATFAALVLRLRGFRHVRQLDGHWQGWQAAGMREETTGPTASSR